MIAAPSLFAGDECTETQALMAMGEVLFLGLLALYIARCLITKRCERLTHSSRFSTVVDLITSPCFCSVSFHTIRRSLVGVAGTSASRNSMVFTSPVIQSSV